MTFSFYFYTSMNYIQGLHQAFNIFTAWPINKSTAVRRWEVFKWTEWSRNLHVRWIWTGSKTHLNHTGTVKTDTYHEKSAFPKTQTKKQQKQRQSEDREIQKLSVKREVSFCSNADANSEATEISNIKDHTLQISVKRKIINAIYESSLVQPQIIPKPTLCCTPVHQAFSPSSVFISLTQLRTKV